MFTVALTGGIASGKTTVARLLSERGAVVISADEVAREIVERGQPALDQIADEFGANVLSDDGTLNRQALAAMVFGDGIKRKILESITHPAIRERVDEKIIATHMTDPAAIIVYDIPLLVGSNQESSFFANIAVKCDEDARIERMVNDRGMSVDDAKARIASQPTDDEREAIADVVIANSGSLEELEGAVDTVWETLSDARSALESGESSRVSDTYATPGVVFHDNLGLHVARLEDNGGTVVGTTRSIPATIMLDTKPPADVVRRFGWIDDGKGALSANPHVGTRLSFAK